MKDELLLALGRGDIPDPALSHFLLHLSECVDCCTRGDQLARRNPDPLQKILGELAPRLENTPPPMPALGNFPDGHSDDEQDWLLLARKLRPSLKQPRIEPATSECPYPTFGPYQIAKTLGEGASAVVYQALEPELGRSVALKVLRPDVADREGMAETFLAEARALATLQSRHLVRLLTYGKTPAPHLTMELLVGRPLTKRLDESPLTETEAVRLARDLALGLKALHLAGLVHRDIKPANVWLSPDAENPSVERAVLMDLGLAGNRNLAAGTPGYQAPELLSGGPPTPATDIFSLGTLLRVMALGADLGPAAAGPAPAALNPLIYKLMDPQPENRPDAAGVVRLTEQWLGRGKATRRAVLAGLAATGIVGAITAWWPRPPKTVREVVVVAQVPKPEGLQPDRMVTGAFTPEEVAGIRQFTMIDGRYVAMTPTGLTFAAAGDRPSVTCPFPDRVEYTVLRDGLLAFARWNGEINIWEISGTGTCKPSGTTRLDTFEDPVVSMHLAAPAEGKLLVHCGKKVYLVERINGEFSGKPRALCKPEDFISATGGAGLVRLEFAPDSRNFLAFTQRGGMVCTRLADMTCVWGFRPFQTGPQLFAPRPGVPGGFAIGSPGGCLGVFGPEIVDDGKLAPRPNKGPEAGLQAPVVQIDWLDSNRLVVLEALPDKPLFVADVSAGVVDPTQLGVASAIRFHVDRATSSLHCLKMNGDVAVWELGPKKGLDPGVAVR